MKFYFTFSFLWVNLAWLNSVRFYRPDWIRIRNRVNNKKSHDKILGLFVDQISPTNCVAELVDADSVNHIVVFLTGQVRTLLLGSVADPGCLSRILIFTHPGSRVQKQQWKPGVEKIRCHTFFLSHKFHKIELFYIWNVEEKKIWAKNILPKKLSLSFQKYVFGIPDPGVKKAPDPESATLQYC